MSGVRCSLIINEEPHICLIESLDEKDIPLNVLTTVKITVISGEINLIAFLEGAKFTLFRGKEVGWGNVDYIEEAYLERENFLKKYPKIQRKNIQLMLIIMFQPLS